MTEKTSASIAADPDPFEESRKRMPNGRDNVIWYAQEASDWSSEALPIGNARMGAMLFGGVKRDRIQFNEQSLWAGMGNWYAERGEADWWNDLAFGGYRNFGDIYLQFATPSPVFSPSGREAGDGNSIENSADGDKSAKLSVDRPGDSVIWQTELVKPSLVDSYSLTSSDGSPECDPAEWKFEASNNGKQWELLDLRGIGKPFERRLQSKTFKVENLSCFRFYRLVFATRGLSHFQVAGINISEAQTKTAEDVKSGVSNYRRELDISTGIHRARFDLNGISYFREAFASRPAQVMAFRFAASKPRSLTGCIELKPGQPQAAITADSNGISASGVMANGLKYACSLRIISEGGSTSVSGSRFDFNNCDSLLLLLDARTDYKEDFTSNWRGESPLPLLAKEIAAALKKNYEVLKEEHLRDLSPLLRRVSVNWGKSDPAIASLPTDLRLGAYAKGGDDPQLEQSMFQYGRYLLASCSRPGGLPANLQGLWNDANNPAWASDYHTNINIQMNYWGAEVANLHECHIPLLDFVEAMAPACRIATRKAFGEKVRGWTTGTGQSIFGGMGGGKWWNLPASAWYVHHFYEHWAFSRDRDFLEKHAYPVAKEICEFWEDRLKTSPDGLLVAPNGWSPEHGPREDGVMHDQQIIWDLFQNYLEMAKALGVDEVYQAKVADMQALLAPNKIGKWGQLQEWQVDRDDPKDVHRHISHLFAAYPGRQISLSQTPGLAEAALKSLRARSGDLEDSGEAFAVGATAGDSRRSWTWPWRCAVWARLGQAERARIMIRGLLACNTLSNLFCNHPPFQIDGNLGISGAIAEMLLQSHENMISLLPACPKEWSKEGFFTGLRARGGFTVDCAWKNGLATSFKVMSQECKDVKIKINGAIKTVRSEKQELAPAFRREGKS